MNKEMKEFLWDYAYEIEELDSTIEEGHDYYATIHNYYISVDSCIKYVEGNEDEEKRLLPELNKYKGKILEVSSEKEGEEGF
tara:strand:- start:52 stop:297 length:246 start_codon:yes stop_codon:yes gene_type:complete